MDAYQESLYTAPEPKTHKHQTLNLHPSSSDIPTLKALELYELKSKLLKGGYIRDYIGVWYRAY